MSVDFCDYFWGEENNGWNVLYQNMKHGHNASKELSEFFKERWSTEEVYCKALNKMANKTSNNNERGTLAPIFSLLKTSLEKMSNIHLSMVNKIQELVKDMCKYNDELHKKHKGIKEEESQTEDVVKAIQATYILASKSKDIYSQRCQDLEKTKREGSTPKEIEKAEVKLRKAHDDYKTIVDKYNTIRDDFEKKMTQSCKRFQTIEENHLSLVLQFGQNYVDVIQNDHKSIGQIHSDLVCKYSQFTIDKLLDNFARSKHTGLEKPVVMVFEDSGSVGSAISGQYSPDPSGDHSKSSMDDTSSLAASTGGVLAGGRVRDEGINPSGLSGIAGVAKLAVGKKESSKGTRGRSSLFSLAKSRLNKVPPNESTEFDNFPADNNVTDSYRKPSSGNSGRRTTSLLNIFSATSSSSGKNNSNREWSAPPFVKCNSVDAPVVEGEAENNINGAQEWTPDTESLPSSPTKPTSTPTSPSTVVEDGSFSRSLFRSSKLALPGPGPLLSFGFLRSRRDKKKEKNKKKKKDTDSPNAKDDKSDNETAEEAKIADLISVEGSTLYKRNGEKEKESSVPSVNLDFNNDDKYERYRDASEDFRTPSHSLDTEPKVDEDGYAIRPESGKPDNSFDSSSDSDSDTDVKKIHVEIKPISNGKSPASASVAELKATIEGMSLYPTGFATTKRSTAEQQNTLKTSGNLSQQMSSSSNDLFGLNLSLGKDGDQVANASLKLSNTNSSVKSLKRQNLSNNQMGFSPTKERYSEFTDVTDNSSSESVPAPALPPRGSRGSTPTPSIALPRPPSRKMFEVSSVKSGHSPSSALSRAESTSSLEFRTSGMSGISRGPSPLTLGMTDTIPLAVAFQEHCHAYFRGTDESKVQMKITGEMMISFPAGIVGVLANNPSPAQLSFKVLNFSNMCNPLPNKQLITLDETQSSENLGVYNFNMDALSTLLRRQADHSPSASFFNVDIIKYQVSHLDGAKYAPLQLVSYWRCDDEHTDIRVDYRYNVASMSQPSPLLNVIISVPVDGIVQNMQSKPHGQWLKDQQKAQWKLSELSENSSDGGKGSLRGKFEVAAGPSTPTTVTAHFVCEGTTLSGLGFALIPSGYRVSLIKKRFISGKYICDADAVLRLRYGIPS